MSVQDEEINAEIYCDISRSLDKYFLNITVSNADGNITSSICGEAEAQRLRSFLDDYSHWANFE